MTKAQRDQAKQDAITDLKQHIHEGDTIFTIQRHRSASGMYRAIDCYVFAVEKQYPEVNPEKVGNLNPVFYRQDGEGGMIAYQENTVVVKLRYTYSIATALGYRYEKKHEAIGIGGCGFDAAHQIVDDLSYTLFGVGGKLRKEEI